MPIVDSFQDPFTRIVTWHVTESVEELLDLLNLSPERLEKFHSMKPKQGKEYLGLRACMQELEIDDDLYYDQRGKPYLQQKKHISITHSYEMVSVGVSSFTIGIDIEMRRNDKILNIRRKFIRPDEAEWIPQNEQEYDFLHVIWGIKEGLYKINGGSLWNFLHHYRVESFNLAEGEKIRCWITDNQTSCSYFAYYTMIDSYFLVWVLDYERV
ncbi:MAG: 4'-phosphopantetheinyl transferase superfamily protein [Weeksellaceae bacterium]|nr:4'-phosphopantetheinyl transferase superfamily protein [Weeksellaceae bacterium]